MIHRFVDLSAQCSPPFANTDLGVTDSVQVFRACTDNTPGLATQITDFSDGRIVNEQLMNPVLSPDGTKILFEIFSSSNDWEIWVGDSAPGSTPTQLVAVVDEHYYYPSWGADSDTFVYVKGTESRDSGAMTILKDTVSAPGSPDTLKTQATGTGRYFARPRFNFDGTRVAYMQFDGTSHTFRCMDDDGSNDVAIDTITGYDGNDPPCISWATTQNLVAWQDGATGVWLSDDTGGGLVELNANGDAAGIAGALSHLAWPADDSFVVYAANLGSVAGKVSVIRAELDGSDTTELSATDGPANALSLRSPIVFDGRIWFITQEGADGLYRHFASMALDGTDYRVDLDVTLGTPDEMAHFGSSWLIYFG